MSSINDPNLNFVQTYDLYYETYDRKGVDDYRQIANDLPVAPDNVGPKTMPNYEAIFNGAIRNTRGGGKTFVGPSTTRSSFGAVFDGINIDKPGRPAIGLGNQGGGKDDVWAQHPCVRLQVPTYEVTRRLRRPVKRRRLATRSSVWSIPTSFIDAPGRTREGRVGRG